MNIDKISLSNFASYEKEILDFRQLGRTVSVFGSTGVGKTTFFIDALTFALYGRAYGQEDKESAKWTLPPGGSITEVDLDFTVNGKRFLIKRKVGRTKPSEAQISLADEYGKGNVLAVGIKEVDRKVDELVGFDYLTFLNTVLVRQGDVAALINRDPKGRREIFLRAFDVDYTKHKEKARSLRDQALASLERLREQKAKLEEVVKEKPQLNKKLEEAIQEITMKESEKQKIKDDLENASKEWEAADSDYANVKGELKRFEEIEKNLEQLKNEQSNKETEVKELEKLVEEKDWIQVEEEKVKALQESYEKASQLVTEINNLSGLLHQLTEEKKRLTRKAAKKDTVEDKLKNAKKMAEQLSSLRTQLSEKKSAYESLSGEVERLRGSLEIVERSLEVLEKAGEEVATCPVCRSSLSKERFKETKRHLQEEIKTLQMKISKLKPQTDTLDTERKALEKQVLECEKEADKLQSLEEEMAETLEAEKELKQVKENIEELSSKVEELNQNCRKLLGYVPSKEQLEGELRKLKKRRDEIEESLKRIAKAEGQIENLRKRLHELEVQVESLKQKLEQAKPWRTKAEELENKLKVLRKRIDTLHDSRTDVEGKLRELNAMVRSFRERLQEIQSKEEELIKTNESIISLEKKHQAYELLYGEVFHEKGFPLALLQDFLHDVETYAEEYISRFLPDKSIRIEADETGRVRINVIDQTEARELATYSGGETILIGFAIRLGIAKAIAERRAAHAPRFLIIDEGFGPLSREFRDEVLKTLNELSQDYERIIVISHIDEIKESQLFSSEIEVFKDPSGHSHLNIIRW
ncbi:MAG: SMC family ATPase [Nitrososphaerales archaeon]